MIGQSAPTPNASTHPQVDYTKFRLGQVLRDKSSGFTGMAVAKLQALNGQLQYGLRPPAGEGNELKDAHFFDYFMLEVAEEGIADQLPPEDETVTVRLGQEAKDSISGFAGVVTERISYENGCVHFWLTARKLNKDGTSQTERFDHKRLIVTGKGQLSKDEHKEARAPDSKPPEFRPATRGGPTRRMETRKL